MPNIVVDIPDTHPSIIRPVVLDIIRDIKVLSGIAIPSKTYFLGATGKALQPNTAVDGIEGEEVSGSDMMLQIEVIDEYPEGSMLTTTVERRDNQPCFLDPILGIMIKPAYSRVDLTLNIKARFPDRMSAVRWRNEFKRHTTQGRRTNLHKVTYSYAIPPEQLMILSAIHVLREKQVGYGDDLGAYIGNHLGYNATTLVNRAGANPLLVISETQANVLGRFDILAVPEPAEVDREKSTWEVTFTYKASLDVPTVTVMQYPLIIHNQMLNARWRPSEVPDSVEKSLTNITLSQYAFEGLRAVWPGEKRAVPGVSYPFFDDWRSPLQLPFYTELIRIAITLDPTDLKDVIDLNNLGDFVIDDLLHDFIIEKPSNLVLLKRSLIKVTLYCGIDPVEDTALTVDADLRVRSVDDLDLRLNYHVTISLLTDLTKLPTDIIDDLRAHGTLAVAILILLYPRLEAEGLLPTLLSNGSISKSDFLNLANIAKDFYLENYVSGGSGSFFTVGFFTIIGRRR